MEWYWILIIIFGFLVLIMGTGMPVALCFLLVNVVGAIILFGGEAGLLRISYAMWTSVTSFVYLPIPMFVLLGEVVFNSGMAMRAIDAVEKWMGRLPGRLALLATLISTLFSTMSGSTAATTAMLGEALLPEMEKRGYKRSITIGSIMGSGGLAMLIPPSGLAIVWAAIAEVSVARVLLAGILPGFLLAFFYSTYIVGRCWLQPSIAPAYDVVKTPFRDRVMNTVKYVLPLTFIVFMVTGLIFVGVATPSEAAAMGVAAGFILAAAYGKLTWTLVRKSLVPTLRISVMILLILSTSKTFSQIVAFTGATQQMITWVTGLTMPNIILVIAMMFILFILKMFMSGLPTMLITLPIFMPIIESFGYDPAWFGILFLLNIEMGQTTPPFGILLFTMKGVAPPGTTMGEIVRAGIPFLVCDALCMTCIFIFPALATMLPDAIR